MIHTYFGCSVNAALDVLKQSELLLEVGAADWVIAIPSAIGDIFCYNFGITCYKKQTNKQTKWPTGD